MAVDKIIIIREEKPEDIEWIWKLNEKAFGQLGKAEIVDKIQVCSKNQERTWPNCSM